MSQQQTMTSSHGEGTQSDCASFGNELKNQIDVELKNALTTQPNFSLTKL